MTESNDVVDALSEEKSKDECYANVAAVANDLINRHGKEFAMGTLVLAAKFIAEDKSLSAFNPDD